MKRIRTVMCAAAAVALCVSPSRADDTIAQPEAVFYRVKLSVLGPLLHADLAKRAQSGKLVEATPDGVKVVGTALARIGLLAGDVITKVGDRTVHSQSDLVAALDAELVVRAEGTVPTPRSIEIVRGGAPLMLGYMEGGMTALLARVVSSTSKSSTVLGMDTTPDLDDAKLVAGIHTPKPHTVEIARSLVEEILGNPAVIARSARFVPSVKDGKPNGFKIYAVRPSSLFGRLGFRNGDTLKAVNGHSLYTPDDALNSYTSLRNAEKLTIDVEHHDATTETITVIIR
jgi:hypothetical protein